jgi:hypothetical protein
MNCACRVGDLGLDSVVIGPPSTLLSVQFGGSWMGKPSYFPRGGPLKPEKSRSSLDFHIDADRFSSAESGSRLFDTNRPV